MIHEINLLRYIIDIEISENDYIIHTIIHEFGEQCDVIVIKSNSVKKSLLSFNKVEINRN
ncbi:hypothetical protein bsdtb5_29510 [Anaeromicropila herbilytica]|uniref:Uncharacterized protein n=1 Tax=Anaeromicropila herbilytica TaxID=2785025 RepID=A0A7R7IE62_9FIRM|nr:hypothetical protein bsdtb5_29510 [Anaeromicropila herbilytica]